jgi:outer membrane protein assembly factor BamA
MKRLICLILIGFFAVGLVSGQELDSTKQEKKIKIIPLPAIFYTPETRLGFGALTSLVFNLGEKSTTRNSNFQLLAAYTLNEQIILQSKHNIFSKDEAMVYNGELSYYDFPILYYGVGNNTLKENEENLAYQVVIFRERVLKKIKENLFIGLQYRFTNLYDIEFVPEFLLGETQRIETQKGKNSGAGLSIVYDSRDNVLNARNGIFMEVSNFFHSKSIGGDFDFNRYTVDLRKYWDLSENDVIATQYFGEFNTSNTPFREMSLMGGETIMRGYYNGRYRDNQQMAIQGEYRRQVLPWLGLTAFSAFGDVASTFDQFDLGDFKWTAGGGLRFMVNKSDRINIRIDYGVGQNTSGFYFAFAEAF